MHRYAYCTVLFFLAFFCRGSYAQIHAEVQKAGQTNEVGKISQLTQSIALKFGDFYKSPVGSLGLEMTETLRLADAKLVTLVGYMVQQEKPLPGRFMLTPRPVQMSEHADGEADDLPPATVVVYLDTTQQNWMIPHVRGLVSLTGTLSVGLQDEAAGRSSWVRLLLPPEAARSMSLFELFSLQHNLQHRH
jgi:hypothetical protein